MQPVTRPQSAMHAVAFVVGTEATTVPTHSPGSSHVCALMLPAAKMMKRSRATAVGFRTWPSILHSILNEAELISYEINGNHESNHLFIASYRYLDGWI